MTQKKHVRIELRAIKIQLPKLLTGSSKSAQDERAKVEKILGGDTFGSTVPITRQQLQDVLKIIQQRKAELPGEEGTIGSQYSVGQTVTGPDGRKYKITGFDPDGTPLGEPVQ